MKTRAAVLRDMGKDWEIIEMDLDPPKEGEVLVRFAAAGLCHSDDHLRTGDIPVRYPIVGGHEGRRSGRGGRRRRDPAQARRPHRLLVPADLRALPVLRPGHDQPVRPRGAVRGQLPAGRHVPVPCRRRGLRPDVPARHVLRAVGGVRAFVHQDRRRPAAGDGGAGRLRGADRLGHRGQRGRRPAGRHDRDLRDRRRRHQRGPGRGVRGCPQRHRGRPAGVQAGARHGVRRHPRRGFRGGRGRNSSPS